jgi:acylphosphatase
MIKFGRISDPEPEVIQRRVFVSGQVQGVGFRRSTHDAAIMRCRAENDETELLGFVRNLDDGRVEAVFCGPPRVVNWLVAWCHHGPSYAQVERIEVTKEKPDLDLEPFIVEDPFEHRIRHFSINFPSSR